MIRYLATAISFALLNVSAAKDVSEKTLPAVKVLPDQENAQTAGSAEALDEIQLRSAHVTTTNEALRKLPGLHVRDEEGFGIRPNIGVRGLNPTRSTKVLLLEDGAPASYAPYGDNASYYHAPIERYQRIEMLKGAEMLRFGPQTIGAVINYLTPDPDLQPRAFAQLSGGSNGFWHGQTRFAGAGFPLDLSQKQGDGARDNNRLKQQDGNLKWQGNLGEHGFSVKISQLREDSQVSYTGITDAEFAAFGTRYNPFKNDQFDMRRTGAQLAHRYDFSDALRVETSLYASEFDRDWWRQASSTTDTQCGVAFRDARLAGRAVSADMCASVQGRLRAYETRGIEPRMFWTNSLGQLELGTRLHRERQERRQVNGTSAFARTGTISESNVRKADAESVFVAQRMQFDALSVFPIVRFERVTFDRRNDLNGRFGSEQLEKVLPGVGANYRIGDSNEVFFSAHRGFAPPRVEDLIDNNGGGVDVGADDSRQIELGWRRSLQSGGHLSLTAFRSDFSNQVAVGSVAGGGVPLAEGEALYQGLELSSLSFFELEHSRIYLESALTTLPKAEQSSAFIAVMNRSPITGSAAGLRMPYAPRNLGTLRSGWLMGEWEFALEASHIGAQFADFANLRAATGNGQFGRIGGNTQFHANVNWRPSNAPLEIFLAIKNVTDKEYIADRTRGLLFGLDRRVQVGISTQF